MPPNYQRRDYGKATYWDDRYEIEKEENTYYDWLANWEDIKPIMETQVMKDLYKPQKTHGGDRIIYRPQDAPKGKSKILNIGCGNSQMTEEMYDEGYTDITNIDISAFCIEQMKAINLESRPLMKWLTMDCTKMDEFSDNSFDIIIDKSTIDALLCDHDTPFVTVAKSLYEMQRVLKPSGYLITISFGPPEHRVFHLTNEHLVFDFLRIQVFKMNKVFVYIM